MTAATPCPRFAATSRQKLRVVAVRSRLVTSRACDRVPVPSAAARPLVGTPLQSRISAPAPARELVAATTPAEVSGPHTHWCSIAVTAGPRTTPDTPCTEPACHGATVGSALAARAYFPALAPTSSLDHDRAARGDDSRRRRGISDRAVGWITTRAPLKAPLRVSLAGSRRPARGVRAGRPAASAALAGPRLGGPCAARARTLCVPRKDGSLAVVVAR